MVRNRMLVLFFDEIGQWGSSTYPLSPGRKLGLSRYRHYKCYAGTPVDVHPPPPPPRNRVCRRLTVEKLHCVPSPSTSFHASCPSSAVDADVYLMLTSRFFGHPLTPVNVVVSEISLMRCHQGLHVFAVFDDIPTVSIFEPSGSPVFPRLVSRFTEAIKLVNWRWINAHCKRVCRRCVRVELPQPGQSGKLLYGRFWTIMKLRRFI